ncbi:protein phosphatase CheZ [Candidatus Nitrospira nitrificans]|uniref:Putative Chemotaxis regulator CheZ n=1 Tax=Candidatus Nitrospira nitrificans TaxID=1742973 RepID=A0A0S4L479_9BACT|nr:protein phosphatase CheZ [Candidatus Nitrospira nitrificans]CUS31502.1 putative Chemotaxis regulator CheZ [Candidatus Nitrospira nitrificans]
MYNQEHKLYEELGALARFVDNARNAISTATPQITSINTQLPAATSHLSDLSKMTEDGTLEVMRLTEIMQDNHERVAKDLSAVVEVLQAMDCVALAGRLGNVSSVLAQDNKYLTEIMTALSFQDLVAQRVKKLVVILDEVQGKLMELVVVFGLQGKGEAASDAGTAGHLLKQLEESKTTAMQQKVADDILAQFGFK